MSWARAASRSVLTVATVARQRGRAPQFPFIISSTRSAVVLASTVTGFSSGTSGNFTLAHSLMMPCCAGFDMVVSLGPLRHMTSVEVLRTNSAKARRRIAQRNSPFQHRQLTADLLLDRALALLDSRPMSTMIAEVYDALKEAGASEEKAKAAAMALADYSNRFDRIDLDLASVKGEVPLIKSDVAVLKTDVAVLKTDVTVLKADVAVV